MQRLCRESHAVLVKLKQSHMRTIILAAILALSSSACLADDDADIVTGCLMSNAEFGVEMAQLCIRENQAARAAVLRYPDDVKEVVVRCSRRTDMGWEFIRKCIDDDIAAVPALEAYAMEHGPLVARCRDELGGQGAASMKLCVEKAIETEKSRGNN